MSKNIIFLEGQNSSNDLDASKYHDGVGISVFEFSCILNKTDTIKLRDFLNKILETK